MKRAIITIVNDNFDTVYSRELNPDLEYRIKYDDGEWVASVEPNCKVGEHK